MVTSRDVARAAGVSQATVSRVLSAADSVKPATRERVLEAMRAVGYLPNRSARAMRTGRSDTVGVVVADLTNPFYPRLVEALSRALDERGVRLSVWVSDGAHNQAALEAIADRSVDGVVFTTVDQDSAELRTALERRSPLVLVNRTLPEVACDQVSSDNIAGARLVTEHVLSTGSTRPAFVGGAKSSSTTTERREGFLQALDAAGVDAISISDGAYSHASGREQAGALFAVPGRVDAVVCSNDLLAFGAMDAALEHGLQVPGDVRIAGYDDVPPAAWARLDLTTVRQDADELAARAVEQLMERIDRPEAPAQEIRVEPQLIVRGSTAAAVHIRRR